MLEFSEVVFLPVTVQGKRAQISFPLSLETYLPSKDKLGSDTFSHFLRLFGGHIVLCAWYAAIWNVLKGRHRTRATQLYKAALTAAIRMRVVPQPPMFALESVAASESLRVEEKALTDAFLHFTDKVAFIVHGEGLLNHNAVNKPVAMITRVSGALCNRHMYKRKDNCTGIRKRCVGA